MGKFHDAIEKTSKDGKKQPANTDIPNECLMEFDEDTSNGNISKNGLDKKLICVDNPSSFEAEQIRILKTNILSRGAGKVPQTILITSAVPYEGKSFVSANLAISLAHSIDRHSVLVDCDLRMPSVHRLFGYEIVPGLSDCLNDGQCISNILLKTPIPKLSLIPAGNLRKNPSELLSSNEMVRLINEVKERYSDRMVILDSPPPSLASETKAISRHVDGIIIVVKLGSTRRELVLELIESLGRDKIIGVVVNWFDMRSLLSFLYGKYSKYERYYRKYRYNKEGRN